MRHFFLFLMLVMTMKMTAQNNCNAPNVVRDFYRNDAGNLAVRLMLADSVLKDKIAIPTDLFEKVMNSLVAVYNEPQHLESDSVTRCYNIHTFPFPGANRINLSPASNFDWVNKLVQNIIPTGYAPIDDLLTTHHLFAGFGSTSNLIVLETQTPLNTAALIKALKNISGVNDAYPEYLIGDSNDILIQPSGNNLILTYELAWGDCPAGCIFGRRWKFKVSPDCFVSYEGVSGDHPFMVSCSNAFQCGTQPLCLDWVRDTIIHYQSILPTPTNFTLVGLNQIGNFILRLDMVQGVDAMSSRFYHCDGQLVGVCNVTIAGLSCSAPVLETYLGDGTTFWKSPDPLPSLSLCNISSANQPVQPLLISMAPNPGNTSTWINVEFDQNVNGIIQIFDSYGQLLTQKSANGAVWAVELELENLPDGIYFVSVIPKNGTISTRKLIVVK